MTKSSKRSTAVKATPATPAPTKASRAAPDASAADAGKISKTQLIDLLAERTGLTKKQAAEAVTASLEVIVSSLQQGHTVGLPGLGTLSVRATAARTGVRPGTSERVQIPAGKKVGFKVATDLKSSL